MNKPPTNSILAAVTVPTIPHPSDLPTTEILYNLPEELPVPKFGYNHVQAAETNIRRATGIVDLVLDRATDTIECEALQGACHLLDQAGKILRRYDEVKDLLPRGKEEATGECTQPSHLPGGQIK